MKSNMESFRQQRSKQRRKRKMHGRGIDRSATAQALASDSESGTLASAEEAHREQQPSSIGGGGGGGGGRRLRRAGEALDWEFGMR
jgi:hypothetical protein